MIAPSSPLVLVVDDDVSIREALERALRLAGFRACEAGDGRAAIAAIERQTPAAVILDVTMPELDGVQVARRVRAGGDDVPILILSARDGIDDRVAGLAAGADDYLVKPFAMPELLARVDALLRRRPDRGRVGVTVGSCASIRSAGVP